MERRCFQDVVDEFSNALALGIDGIFRCMCAGAPPSLSIGYFKCDQHDVTPLRGWDIDFSRDKFGGDMVAPSGRNHVLPPRVLINDAFGHDNTVVNYPGLKTLPGGRPGYLDRTSRESCG